MYSNSKNIATRGKAIRETWLKKLSTYWRVVVFANLTAEEKWPGVDYVRLKGVDDYQYPPQKKSFAALRHVANHYSGTVRLFRNCKSLMI